jgi:hypothetical protein
VSYDAVSGRRNEGEPSGDWDDDLVTDWLLERLVELAEQGESVAVTLFVGGILISGWLTGEEDYLNALAEEAEGEPSMQTSSRRGRLRRGHDRRDADVDQERTRTAEWWKWWRNVISTIQGESQSRRARASEKPEQDDGGPRLIHLTNARVLHPTHQFVPSQGGMWWRGRLDRIDGFMIGELVTRGEIP